MNLFRILPILIFTGIFSAQAQITVELEVERDYFFYKETLPAKVRITNFSGRTLELGEGKDWLTFYIEGKDGLVSKILPPEVEGKFKLETSQVATKTVDLAHCFDLSQPGNYKVTASVTIPQFNNQVLRSSYDDFHIVSGHTIWSLDFGMPVENEKGQRPEFRKYELLKANRLDEILLYFRLSSGSGSIIHQVYPLGRMVSFSDPVAQVDRGSNLHVLYQYGARSFIYFSINPDGRMLKRQVHMITQTRPSLRTTPDGEIGVVGGVRNPTSHDIPKTPPTLSSKEP